MDAASARILIVEDEAIIAMMLADMLTDAGYQIAEADGPAAALAMVEHSGLPDLIISDQSMPGMTGTEMITALIAKFGQVPVLVTSGYALGSDFPHPTLQKPFVEADLLAKVRELIEG